MNNLKLGQHFLINNEIVKKMVSYISPSKDDYILEIGGGEGALTEKLAPLVGKLDVIEIDEKLKNKLNEKIKCFNNVNLLLGDVQKKSFIGYNKIVSSLPYHILEPFLKKCCIEKVPYVFILIGEKYGKSLFCENFSEKRTFTNLLTICFYHVNVYDNVTNINFNPRPKTNSVFVEFSYAPKEHLVKIKGLFLMRELFEQADKKIKNALLEGLINMYKIQNFTLSQRHAKEIIKRNNFDENILNKKIFELSNEDVDLLSKSLDKALIFLPDKN